MNLIVTTYQPKQYTQGNKPSKTGMLYFKGNDLTTI